MIIYTQGSFDIIHSGHMNLLRKCRLIAGKDGKVVVSVLSDRSYTKYRGYIPAKPFTERKRLIEDCKYVDEVIEGDNEKTKDEIKKCNADLVVVGSDWATKNIYKQYDMDEETLNEKLVYHPYTTGITSSMIKERIKNGK